MNYTREQVIKEVQRDLDHVRIMQKNGNNNSDMAYWSLIARAEFLEANLKYLNVEASQR